MIGSDSMKYYAELLKIIEGGLRGDKQKISDYSILLAKKLKTAGEERKSERIEKILARTGNDPNEVFSSSFKQVPFDHETKLEIASIIMPNEVQEKKLIYNLTVNQQVDEFIASYQELDQLASYGLNMPSTLLLYGPPGCGKTELALHISRKLNLPIVLARLDTLISSYLGSTSKNIRMLFEYAAKTPCILFLDEFDAVAKLRDDPNELGELKRVVNSLLQNIDLLNDKSVLIAATNHENLLDKAIWRRFSTRIHINYPNTESRYGIINHILEEIGYNHINQNFIEILVNMFENLSVADIEQIVKRSIRTAVIQHREVEFLDFIDCYFSYVPTTVDLTGDLDSVRREKIKFLLKTDPNISQRLLGQIFKCHHNTIRSELRKIHEEIELNE